MKISMVVRADATGLGNQCQDWVMNLPIEKVLVTWGNKEFNPEIYSHLEVIVCEEGMPSIKEIDWLLKDTDLVITIETPYNWSLISKAKEKGVKTIIAPNYEYFMLKAPETPDLWLCYNSLNYDIVPEPKIYVPQPINREAFSFKLKEKAHTFLFNNGNGGVHGRNCLAEFLQAISFVKSDVKFIINSQIPFQSTNDSRIEANIGDLPLKDIWKEGDVFVHLRKFGANSLPINEAMSLGFPVLGVNRSPENTYLPQELLVNPEGVYPLQCRQDVIEIEACAVSPIEIAKKIDELANTDISKYSEMMNKQAEEWSWDNQRSNWIKVFRDLCQSSSDNQTSDKPK